VVCQEKGIDVTGQVAILNEIASLDQMGEVLGSEEARKSLCDQIADRLVVEVL